MLLDRLIYIKNYYYLGMNTIYDIYEGLLTKTKAKVVASKSIIRNLMDTYKERFIKIISHSARMTEKQEDMLRELVDNAISYDNAIYLECNFPKDLMTYLIGISQNTLTKKDFKGFPNNKKEWEFRTSVWRVHFSSVDDRLNLSYLKTIPENKITNYKYNVLRCGKTIIIQANGFICVWVDGIHKIYGNFTNSPMNSCRPIE